MHSNTSTSSYVEIEKQYEYIFVDKQNKIHILIPITTAIPAGKDIVIGGDNTCKALLEIKKFFGLQSDVPSIKDNLDNYIRDLVWDIYAMEEELSPSRLAQAIPQNLKDKKERLEQLYHWKSIVDDTFDYFRNSLSSDSESYGKYPSEVMDLFFTDNQNVVRVELSPKHEDNVTAFPQKVELFSVDEETGTQTWSTTRKVFFSVHRGLYSDTGLGGDLRRRINQADLFKSRPTETKKDILIKNCVKAYSEKYPTEKLIKDDISLNNLKNIIVQEYKNLSGKSLTLESLNTLSKSIEGYTQANWQFFSELCAFDFEGASASEVAPMILSSTVPEYFNALTEEISPLSELCSSDKAELLSVNCQLFLSMINAYCYSQFGINKNFGQIIEAKENKLQEAFAIQIEVAIRTPGLLIEDAILDFFSLHHAHFGLDKNFPSESDRENLKQGFREYYQAVELDSSSHFDEFILCLSEQKAQLGCCYISHSKIVLPFSKVLEKANIFALKELHQKYFMEESRLLSSTITTFTEVYRLPSTNPVGSMTKAKVEEIKIETLLEKTKYKDVYFINLLLKPLLHESDEKHGDKTSKLPLRLHQFLTSSQKKLIRSDPRWPSIWQGVIASLGPEEMEIFCNTWGLPLILHINAKMADAIYSIVSIKDKEKNPLLGLYGANKLQTALELLLNAINIRISPNDIGGYNVFGQNISRLKEKLMPIYNEARCYLHIPRGMAKSIYIGAQEQDPKNKELMQRGAKLSLDSMEDRRQTKNRLDEQQGNQSTDLILGSLQVLKFPFRNITPNNVNGYWLKVKNQKELKLAKTQLQIIYEKYYEKMPAIELDSKDCEKIFNKAGKFPDSNTPAAIRNALVLAFGYAKLNLLIHSMDFRITENEQLFVRLVVDDLENVLEGRHELDENVLEAINSIIGHPAKRVLHPSKDPQFKKNILTDDTSELESLERKFAYHITLNETQQEAICSTVSGKDEFYLLSFYGATRIFEALSFLKLKKDGKISVSPGDKSYKLSIEKYTDYIRIHKFVNTIKSPFLHLTRSMARSMTKTYNIETEDKIGGMAKLSQICQMLTGKTLQITPNPIDVWNGYLVQADDFAALKKIKEIHNNRFKTLAAIKLNFTQCQKWCEKAGIMINPGKKGLRDAMKEVIEYKQNAPYRNVPTAFLEIRGDDNGKNVIMVVENDKQGINKIAEILEVDPNDLRTEHPEESEQCALSAKQNIKLESKENEIKKIPPSLLSSFSSLQVSMELKEKIYLSSVGMFGGTASSTPSSIATATYFPIAADFSEEKWPVQFKFSSPAIAKEIFMRLKKISADTLQLNQDVVQFSPMACQGETLQRFLNCFEYGGNQAAVNDFLRQIIFACQVKATALFPQFQSNGIKDAWKIISTANNQTNGFKTKDISYVV